MRYKKFSVEHLKEVLNELGISERELCKRIGGTKTHNRIQELLPPRFGHQKLIDIANALDVPMEKILEKQDTKSEVPSITGNNNNINSTVINQDFYALQSENEALKLLVKEKDLRIADLQRNLDMVIDLAKAGQNSDT
ncbi:MAG: hypothetical protein J6M37_06355 [Prevotella sp.]|nr:hypothetical protein [Prevotella sp.]